MLGAGFKPVGEVHSQPFDSAFAAGRVVWREWMSRVDGATACCLVPLRDRLLMHSKLLCANAKPMCALYSQNKLNRSEAGARGSGAGAEAALLLLCGRKRAGGCTHCGFQGVSLRPPCAGRCA